MFFQHHCLVFVQLHLCWAHTGQWAAVGGRVPKRFVLNVRETNLIMKMSVFYISVNEFFK